MAHQTAALADNYLAHRFDLMGSGWVQVFHGMRCRGLEGYRYDLGSAVAGDGEGRWLAGRVNASNLAEAQRLWRLIDLDSGYVPIDWHLDFKSGYRWPEDTWFGNVQTGHLPGADIKVPWELARVQHLPQLAIAYALATSGASGFVLPEHYTKEFRNQVIDFISTNPPRFGVNWASAMDVAIRAANWLVAYDLFRAHGATFDAAFERELSRSVYVHAHHIIDNLEWEPGLRGNHYLANIAGLLFCAAYLPRTPTTDAWLAFGVQEQVKEVGTQFNEDGTNFEASTCYHGLSAQTVAYATALVLGLPEEKREALAAYDHRLHHSIPPLSPTPIELYVLPGSQWLAPFPSWYAQRLERMAHFVSRTTKPNGHVPQIGDNDSGRFLKLCPVVHRRTAAEAKRRYANLDGYADLPDDAVYWDEDHLSHLSTASAIKALFEVRGPEGRQLPPSLETTVVRALVGERRLTSGQTPETPPPAERVRVGPHADWDRLLVAASTCPPAHRRVTSIPIQGNDVLDGLRLYGYPDFGLYLFQSRRLYLAVRCGPVGQNGAGGHAHNDQLAIELNVDGEDWIADPGSYLYTPLPHRRNEFRSVKVHFAPRLDGQEPARLDLGLFRLRDESQAKCLYFGDEGFAGLHRGYGTPVIRVVEVTGSGLRITDYVQETHSGVPLQPPVTPSLSVTGALPSSPGYGLILR